MFISFFIHFLASVLFFLLSLLLRCPRLTVFAVLNSVHSAAPIKAIVFASMTVPCMAMEKHIPMCLVHGITKYEMSCTCFFCSQVSKQRFHFSPKLNYCDY